MASGEAAKRGVGAAIARWLKRLGLALLVLAALGAVAVAVGIQRFEAELPSTAELKNYQPPQVTRVVTRDGAVLGELFTERRTVVRIQQIPAHVKLAVLAAEDAGFYEHAGLNYLGMLRALAVNLRSTSTRQGGSTITQQVVKNVLLTPERTYDRKAREVILSRKIEQELTKDEILELYLNKIYFGHSRYGIEEAARYYFGKGVRDVSLAEAAMLAGVVKGPGVYSPRINLQKATARRAFVLDQMQAKGFAEAAQVETAKREAMTLAAEPEALNELAPEVVAEAQRMLRQVAGPAMERGGYTVVTTIDPALQSAARGAVRKNLDNYAKRHKLVGPLKRAKKEPAAFDGSPSGYRVFRGVVTGTDDAKGTLSVQVGTLRGTVSLKNADRYNPKGLKPSEFADVGKVVRVSLMGAAPPSAVEDREGDDAEPAAAGTVVNHVPAPAAPAAPVPLRLELGPESALVAIDVRTREIRALVGSYGATRGGLDRATFAKRQPGSTFKPFVFGYGIKARRMTPATILETNPAALGSDYKPQNYDESEGHSPARLREALAHSVNVAAVSAMGQLGPSNVAAFASSLGIHAKLGTDLSLALGAYEVTPREMATAYATIAAGGVYEEPQLIVKILGPDGAELPLPTRPPSHRVMEEAEAYVLTSLLSSVVQSGTGKAARALGRPIAGKTGTSNQAKDTWFVGFSTDVACAVWTGYDDAVPLGRGEAGASAALPAFVEFMKKAHDKRPITDFPAPRGIVRVKIDPTTGLLANENQEDALTEIFLAGTEPTELAPLPDGGVDGGDEEPAAEGLDAGVAVVEEPKNEGLPEVILDPGVEVRPTKAEDPAPTVKERDKGQAPEPPGHPPEPPPF
ncbi:penicillin-binding protein 1A [Chondromyces crocatus]|uniref:Penicillin-binding protein n=1 Tax=Chondromyces crocatus TaxID=52 RepID=A0A0K1E8N6_CHOCO|nr:PBP1A family penicillin-binding protein [Chondromyces crocatus]AKT37220.1 penicillin-binding protein [Chondromyces crocatus]